MRGSFPFVREDLFLVFDGGDALWHKMRPPFGFLDTGSIYSRGRVSSLLLKPDSLYTKGVSWPGHAPLSLDNEQTNKLEIRERHTHQTLCGTE
jgi:hypothetical protein